MAKKPQREAPTLRKDLSKFKGCSCSSFRVRETNGFDEEMAAQAAKKAGGSIGQPEELIRLAIVEVDDKPVEQPFSGFELWNTKTRAFAMAAWNQLNAPSADEVADFLKDGDQSSQASPPEELFDGSSGGPG